MSKQSVSTSDKSGKSLSGKKAASKASVEAQSDKTTTLIKAQTPKLSPKADGHITFQLIKDVKGALAIQLLENTSGGIFSKNPIPLEDVVALLGKQSPNRPFKSSLVKGLFSGKGSKSANNASFLIAVLRSKEIGFIVPSESSQFLSVLDADFKAKSKALLEK